MSTPKRDDGPTTSLSDYIAAMKKKTFTLNWDVVVTYDQQKINELLAQRFKEHDHGMVTEVKLSFDADSPYGTYKQWYDFQLGSPLIHFQSTPDTPTCSLKTTITGGKIWCILENGSKADEKDLEPNAYTITIDNINLGTVTGNEEDTKDPKKASMVTPANDVVIFPDDNTHSAHIVIDMPTSDQLVFNVDHPTIPKPPFAMKDGLLLSALKEFFTTKIQAIEYSLAIVNNTKPSSGTNDLVPKALRFATIRVSDTLSYLSIFIQTQNSEKRGNSADLQAKWITLWSNANVRPVPTDQSASIIINNSFFVSTFVDPALTKYKATCKAVLMKDEDGGIRVQGTWPKLTRPKLDWSTSNRATFDKQFEKINIPSVDYDPNSGSPLQITFTQSKGTDQPATVSVDWSYSFSNDWSGTLYWLVNAPRVGPVTQTQDVKGSFTSKYSISSTQSLTTLSDESFTVNIGLKKSDWKVDVTADAGSDFWEYLLVILGGTLKDGTVPQYVKDHAIDTIDFNLDFGTLRFFSLTNILLPGKKVIDVDIHSGVRVPRDVVVVGNVVKSLDTKAVPIVNV